MKVIAIVGMPGAGKSAAARVFERNGFYRVRFGDITDAEMAKRGLEPSEASERRVRELLRQELGMAAYAKLNLPRIKSALERTDVVADGLYSWEEYLFFKEQFGDSFHAVAVCAAPATRYARLARRPVRPLTLAEAAARDRAEIENVNKGGPIAMSDFTIINEGSLEGLERETERILASLKS